MKIKLLIQGFVTSSILSLLTINISIEPSIGCTMKVSETKLIHILFIKGEMAQYLDRGKFTESLAELGFINQIKKSKIYDYSLNKNQNSVFLHGVLKEGVSGFHLIRREPGFPEILIGWIMYMFHPCSHPPSRKIPYKSYILAVFATPDGSFKNIACQADKIGYVKLKEPFIQGNKPVCAEGSSVWQEADLLY
jgi:hypothetical protein